MAINLSQVITEFGGPSTLTSYLRGVNVPNHGNNGGIPVDLTSPINLSSFNSLGTATGVNLSYLATMTEGTASTYYGYDPYYTTPYGSITTTGVGKAKNTLAVATLRSLSELVLYAPSQGVNSNTLYLYFNGDQTGTWWTTLRINNGTQYQYTRASAAVPNGTYVSGNATCYWQWALTANAGVPVLFNGTGTSAIEIVL